MFQRLLGSITNQAKASAPASSFTKEEAPSVNQKLLQLRSELAIILENPKQEVSLINHKDGLYGPINGLMIKKDKNRDDAGKDLRPEWLEEAQVKTIM
jgi:hypothetical protein